MIVYMDILYNDVSDKYMKLFENITKYSAKFKTNNSNAREIRNTTDFKLLNVYFL